MADAEGDVLVVTGGGKIPDNTWGYLNVSRPFLRLRLNSTRVRAEPSFLRNWIVFRVPDWEANWDDLKGVEVKGNHVEFIPKKGPVFTYFATSPEAVMACVHEQLRAGVTKA